MARYLGPPVIATPVARSLAGAAYATAPSGIISTVFARVVFQEAVDLKVTIGGDVSSHGHLARRSVVATGDVWRSE